MRDHRGLFADQRLNPVVQNDRIDRRTHTGCAGSAECARHIVQTGLQIGVNDHAVASLGMGTIAKACLYGGLAHDGRNRARHAGRSRRRRARHRHDDGLIVSGRHDHDVLAGIQLLGYQAGVFAHQSKHLVIEYIDIDGCAHSSCAAVGAGGRRQNGNLSDDAVSHDGHAAADAGHFGFVPHLRTGLRIGNQHADGARHRGRRARGTGQGGQHIQQLLLADRLNDHIVFGENLRRVADRRQRLVLGDNHGHRAARGSTRRRSAERRGQERQIGKILRLDREVARGLDLRTVTHIGLDIAARHDDIDAAAQRRGAVRTGDRSGCNGHSQHIALRIRRNGHVMGIENLNVLANTRFDLIPVLQRGDIHARADLAGGRGDRTADHAAVGLRGRRDDGIPAVQLDDHTVADQRPGFSAREHHGHGARQRARRVGSRRDRTGDGLGVVVHGGQIVQRVKHLHQIVHAKGNVDSDDAVLAVFRVNVDDALLLLLRHVRREQRRPVKGELVILGGDALLLGVHPEAPAENVRAIIDERLQGVVRIDQRKRSADAHLAAAGRQPARADRELRLVNGFDENVARSDHGILGDDRIGARLCDEDRYRAGKAHLTALSGHAARQGLRAEQAAIPAVHVLRERRSHANIAVGLLGFFVARRFHFALQPGICLVVVDGNRHADSDAVAVAIERRNGGAGAEGAVIGAVFSHDIHVGCVQRSGHLCLCDVRGDVHTGSCGQIDLLSALIVAVQRLTVRAAGIGRSLAHRIGRRAGRCWIRGQRDVQPLQECRQKRKSADRAGAGAHGRSGKAVQLRHDLRVHGVRRHTLAEAEHAEHAAQPRKIAVQAGADNGRQTVRLVLVGRAGLDDRLALDNAVSHEGGHDVGVRQIHGHRRADRRASADRKAGRHRGGLTSLIGAQPEIGLFKGSVCQLTVRGDDVSAAQRELGFAADARMNDVVDHGERNRRIHGDVLFRGVVLRKRRSSAQLRRRVRDAVPPGQRIAARHGHRVDVVAQLGNDAERARLDMAVVAQDGLDFGGNRRNRSRSADAHRFAAAVAAAVLVLDRHAVLVGGGAGRRVHLLRALRQERDRVIDNDVRAGRQNGLSRDRRAGAALDHGHRRSAGNADIRRTDAGDSRRGNQVAHAVQLAGIAEAGVHGGNHHVPDRINRHAAGHPVLVKQGFELCARLARQQAEQELRLRQRAHEIIDHALGEGFHDGVGRIQRLIAELHRQHLQDEIAERLLVLRIELVVLLCELGILLEHLFQRIAALRIQKRFNEHLQPLRIREVLHQALEDLLDRLLFSGFQDVRRNGQRFRADGLRADVRAVAVAHIVDRDADADALRGVGRARIGGNHRVRIHKGGHLDIARGLDRQVIADARQRFVLMDVQRKGCGNLNAALGRLRLRTSVRRVVDSGGIDVLGVELRGQVLGRLGVLVGDLVRFALVEQIAHILAVGVQRIVAAGNHLVVVILRAAVGIRLARRRAALWNRAVGARQNLLVETAHAGRLDEHAGGILHPALHGRVCGVIQDRDAERAAKADRAAHGRCVHHHVPYHAAVGAHSQPAGELQRLIRAAQIRLSSQTADGQRQHGHNRPAARCTGSRLHMLLARIVRNHGKGLKRDASKADAVLDHGRHIDAGQADRDARADAGRAAGEAVRRSERNLNARDGEAAPRALAGGIANRDVIAAADRRHVDGTTPYTIGSVFPDHRIGRRLGQMHGDRAAKAKVRSIRNMACLHDDRGRSKAQICIHVQRLRGNPAADDLSDGFLAEHHHADAGTDRLVRLILGGCTRDVVKRRSLIERAVRAQIGYRLAAGIHEQGARCGNLAQGVNACRGGGLDVPKAQRTHQLGGLLSAGRFRLRGLGSIRKQIAQGVGARRGADDLAEECLVLRPLHADELLDKGNHPGYRIITGRLRRGHADGNGIREDTGGGSQPDITIQGDDRSAAENLGLRLLLDVAGRDEHTRLGLERNIRGRLARGKGGSPHEAVRRQADIVLRLNARIVPHLHRGVDHGQHQRDGELQHAARRVRRQPRIGNRIQLDAGAGRHPRILRHRDQGAAAGRRHSDRNDLAQRAVGRVDADVQLAADAHRAERLDGTQHVHRSLAELQNEGIELDDPGIRNVALVQREARQHIQRAFGRDVRVLPDLDPALAFRLVETELHLHAVFLIQIVLDDAELSFHNHIVRADGMQQDILAGHIAGYLDVSAGDDQIEIGRLNAFDLDAAFLVRRGGDDVRQEQTALGHGEEVLNIQAQ